MCVNPTSGISRLLQEEIVIYFFLGAAFLAALGLAAFLAAGFFAAGFLAALGLAAFLAAGFFAAGFFAFLAALGLAAFLALGFFAFLALGFFAFGSLAGSLKEPAPFLPAAAAATIFLAATI